MNRIHVGWGFLLGGVAVSALESMAQADAQLNGTTFANTGIGKLVAPIETYLPVSVGIAMVMVGVVCLWVVPIIGGGD